MSKIIDNCRLIRLELARSLKLAFPLICSQLVYAINGLLLIMMVARLGHYELATNVIVWGIYIALVSLSFGLLSAIPVLISQNHGANNLQGIRTVFSQGFILSIFLSFVMVFVLWNTPYILIWTGQDEEIITRAIPYCQALSFCIFPLNILFVIEQFLIGLSITKMVLFVSLLRVPLELLVFYIFLFGVGEMPALGLPGIGYGITISVGLALGLLLLYLGFSKKIRAMKLFSHFFYMDLKCLAELLKVGLPLSTMYFIEMALFAAMALMIGKFGSEVLAAHQVAYQYLVFMLAIIFGISQGATVRVGYEVGSKNIKAVQIAACINLLIGFAFVLLVSLSYVKFTDFIIGLSVDGSKLENQNLIKYAGTFLLLVGILQLTDSFRLISMGILRGLKDTKSSMFITFITFGLVAFPLSYYFAFWLNYGGQGVWWGIITGLAMSAIFLILRVKKKLKTLDFNSEKI